MKIVSIALAVLLLSSMFFLPGVSAQTTISTAITGNAISIDDANLAKMAGFQKEMVKEDLVRLRQGKTSEQNFPIRVLTFNGQTNDRDEVRGYLLVMTSLTRKDGTAQRETSVVGRISIGQERVDYLVKGGYDKDNSFELAAIPVAAARLDNYEGSLANLNLDEVATSGRVLLDFSQKTGSYKIQSKEGRINIQNIDRAVIPEVFAEDKVTKSNKVNNQLARLVEADIVSSETARRVANADEADQSKFFQRIRYWLSQKLN